MPREYTCEQCGVVFVDAKGGTVGRFCSVACWRAQQRSQPIDGRFWAKVDKSGECWIWTAACFPAGYAQIRVNGKTCPAHRIAWELATGETLTDEDVIGHTCDVRNCVRNDDVGVYVVNGVELPRVGHLFKGTDADNMADMAAKGRGRPGLQLRPELAARGSRNGNAKLTERDIREIRQRYDMGESQRSLAAAFGVTQGLVGHIVRRLIWRHV